MTASIAVLAVLLVQLAAPKGRWLVSALVVAIISMPLLGPSVASSYFLRGSIYRIVGLLIPIAILVHRSEGFRMPPLGPFRYLLAFFGVCLASSLTSDAVSEALFRSVAYAEPVLFALLAGVLTYSVPGAFVRIQRAMFVALGIAVGVGLIQILLQDDIMQTIGFTVEVSALGEQVFYMNDLRTFSGRITSTLGQPVFAAFFFLALSALPFSRLFRHGGRKAGMALLTMALVLCIYTTGTRASYPILALIVGTLLYQYGARQRKVVVGTLIVAALFLSVFVTEETVDYLVASYDISTITETNTNSVFRIALTLRMIDFGLQRPLLGHGPGFVQKASVGSNLEFVSELEGLSGQENQFVVLFADTGFVGLIVYLAFIVALIRMLRNGEGLSTDLAEFGRILSVVAFGFFLGSLTVSNLTSVPMTFLLMLSASYLGAAARERSLAVPRDVVSAGGAS